ncbi:fatty acid hydroxylase family protein [Ostertagia ostertagi]
MTYPSFSKYLEALKLVLFNQFVTGVIVTTVFHYPMKFTGVSFDKKLPGVTTVLAQIVVCVFVEEIGFYYSHRCTGEFVTLTSWEERHVLPSFSKYLEALRLVLFNQFVTGVIVTTVFHYPMKFTGVSFDKKLPVVTTVLAQIVVCIFVEEIGFYYSHRLFHHPKIYKHVHKIHHEWTTPVSITSIYCHPIEHAFSNLIPGRGRTAAQWCFSVQRNASVCWVFLTTSTVLQAHSGVRGPFSKRHITYFSLTPIKEIFPDK